MVSLKNGFLIFNDKHTVFNNPEVVCFSKIESFSYYSKTDDYAYVSISLPNNKLVNVKYKTLKLARKTYLEMIEIIKELPEEKDF